MRRFRFSPGIDWRTRHFVCCRRPQSTGSSCAEMPQLAKTMETAANKGSGRSRVRCPQLRSQKPGSQDETEADMIAGKMLTRLMLIFSCLFCSLSGLPLAYSIWPTHPRPGLSVTARPRNLRLAQQDSETVLGRLTNGPKQGRCDRP